MNAMLEQLKGGVMHEQRIATAQDRKQQVGSGMRGDKIRTYRFQDDVVKDHNTDRTATVSKVMRGYFDLMW